MKQVLLIIIGAIGLFACKAKEQALDVSSSRRVETQQHSAYTDLRDTLYSYNYVVHNRDTLTMEVVKPVFHKYKDSVSVEKLYNNKVSPGDYKGKIKSADELYFSPGSVVSYLYLFVDIAKSGDSEAEAWLLDFYDRYFSYCVERYESGYIRDLYIEPRTPIAPSDFRRIKQIFPSIIKVDMLAELYGVQSGMGGGFCLDCEVYNTINRDIFDPNQVMGTIEFSRIYRADREKANQVFQELLDGIRSGNIKLRPRK